MELDELSVGVESTDEVLLADVAAYKLLQRLLIRYVFGCEYEALNRMAHEAFSHEELANAIVHFHLVARVADYCLEGLVGIVEVAQD